MTTNPFTRDPMTGEYIDDQPGRTIPTEPVNLGRWSLPDPS